jgi:hypothetical protein
VKGVVIMKYSKMNTLGFLESLLIPLIYKDPEEAQTEIVGKIYMVTSPEVIEMMKADNTFKPEVIDQIKTIDPKVVSNFETGYLKAVEKYGLVEGHEKMKERLIKTILMNDHHDTREALFERCKKARAFGIIYGRGLHINLDENEEENI